MGQIRAREWRSTAFRTCFVLLTFSVILGLWRFSAYDVNLEKLKSMAGFQHSSHADPLQSIPLPEETEALCAGLPGADDILVVFRTGVAVAHEMLPFHMNTTFRCTDRYLVLSDIEEDVYGHRTIDILASVPQSTREREPGFRVYDQMLEEQAAGKTKYKELLESPDGKLRGPQSPGWSLDKWKFMPMLKKALEYQAKWYFFMETDTSVVWSNLVEWLSMFDSSQEYWLGSSSPAGLMLFAHGGSGFAMSRPALQKAVDQIDAHYDHYENLFAHDCCGDVKLGNIMEDAGISITRSRPSLYGGRVHGIGFNKWIWCFPAITYHHMKGLDIAQLWKFEQDWLNKTRTRKQPILMGDVFSAIVKPEMDAMTLDDWNNESNDKDIEEDGLTYETCRDRCLERPWCKQFAFLEGERCTLDHDACLGQKLEEDDLRNGKLKAGFVIDRIEELQHEMAYCSPKWPTEHTQWD